MTDLKPDDLVIQAYSSKDTVWTLRVPNGVRIIHRPSGLGVVCEKHRSQHKNRDEAMAELREKLGLPAPAH